MPGSPSNSRDRDGQDGEVRSKFQVDEREASLRSKNGSSDKGENETPETSDVEQAEGQNDLQRELSGPPYSIFSPRMKMWIIFLVSVSAVISPFAATTYYPALNVMAEVLDVTPTLTNVSVTTYMVCSA